MSRLGLMATPPKPFSIKDLIWLTSFSLVMQEFHIQIAQGRVSKPGFSKRFLMFFKIPLLINSD
jgi:hypothetical protein